MFLTNNGPDVAVMPGTVGTMQDIGVSIPHANNVSIERVYGSNFGEGVIDWEGGERLFVNFVQAESCLLDVNWHILTPLPVNGPGFDSYPTHNPLGCVVMNGTDGIHAVQRNLDGIVEPVWGCEPNSGDFGGGAFEGHCGGVRRSRYMAGFERRRDIG